MDAILVRVFAGIASVITTGWFVVFVILPIFRPDYQPPNEVTVAMTAVITAIAGLLGGAYFKARRALGDEDDQEGGPPGGDGNDR